jgi:hypothetical protein
MTMPAKPKIYHIVHVDRLASIIASGGLLSDAQVLSQNVAGTSIGMHSIKQRRLQENTLTSHPNLTVGQCVPFYFCPRSIMLYLIHQANHPELDYKGGQSPIIHLQADLMASVQWAAKQKRSWAFTLSNAGSYFFEDRANLDQLDELDWDAIQATQWQSCKDGKQAEFLIEKQFPWHLIEKIGVIDRQVCNQVVNILHSAHQQTTITIEPTWYY